MRTKSYEATFRAVGSLNTWERSSMARLYLSYYDNANEAMFFQDLDAKTEVVLLHCQDDLVGFSTLLLYDAVWRGQTVRIAYSGDTIVHRKHWGQQKLSTSWLRYMGHLKGKDPSLPIYWFLLVKGHRTYRFMPTFAYEFHPDPDTVRPELKLFADQLATEKFGRNYNPATGIVEFECSLGNLKEEIAYPSEQELKKPDVRFFLEKNPNYMKGHELVCLCLVAPDNMKPFARRVFEAGIAEYRRESGA